MVGFEREVAGVVETHLGARVVAFERFRTRSQKERITLTPDRQQRRLLGAEIFLELGVANIAGIEPGHHPPGFEPDGVSREVFEPSADDVPLLPAHHWGTA